MTVEGGSGIRLEFRVKPMDFSTAGEGASRIKRTMSEIGLDPTIIRRAAISAYEMEMNLVIHAGGGILRAEIDPEKIEIIADDEGPGISDIELAMQAGYSTAPPEVQEMGFGAGMGLPNIRKHADDFEIESTPGRGTRVRVVIHNR